MTRHLDPIPEQDGEVLLGVVDRARAQATRAAPADLRDAYLAAEAQYPAPRTGYKLARVTAAAGAAAAHTLRLEALADSAAAGRPWVAALARTGATLSSWDWDERMQCALDLRKTFKDVPDPDEHATTIRPVRLVAAWLTHAGGRDLVPASTRLCAELDNHHGLNLAGAWYAVHGTTLLQAIVTAGPVVTEGRATAEQAAHRARLRAVVAGLADAQVMTNSELARQAGVTRTTLISWHQRPPHQAG